MNEPNSAAEAIPHAVVSRRKRRFSLVWVVPIVAALIGGWLVVKALSEKGPEITIYFNSAESLEAGKTKVKYKDVDIGLVTDIAFDKDFRPGAALRSRWTRRPRAWCPPNTRFWVVRARVSMAAVSGLGPFSRAPTSRSTPATRRARSTSSPAWKSPRSSPAACRASTSSSKAETLGLARSRGAAILPAEPGGGGGGRRARGRRARR